MVNELIKSGRIVRAAIRTTLNVVLVCLHMILKRPRRVGCLRTSGAAVYVRTRAVIQGAVIVVVRSLVETLITTI